MDTYLAIIQYHSEADQVFLVQNNMQIFEYIEDPISGTNAMLTVLNDQQKDVLMSKGYYIQLVEQNPNLDNYVFLYHELPDQGRFLNNLGEIYLLSQQYTLVKLHEGIQFESTGKAAEFVILPLEDKLEQIAKRNEVKISADRSSTTENTSATVVEPTSTQQESSNMQLPVLIGVVILIVVLVISALVYLRKTRAVNN